MTKANNRQVGGKHYRNEIQHWDWAFSNGFDYFQGQITKYIARWRYKNGIQDLEKALHFLEKYIELQKEETAMADVTVNITGVGSETTVNTSDEKRFRVQYTNGEVIASFNDQRSAMEFVRLEKLKNPTNAYQIINNYDGEPGAPTSAYVNQD
tara:strand:- start:714 stop:1172 length:459 start_codon:yes stop_codon:yes gene_type:complete